MRVGLRLACYGVYQGHMGGVCRHRINCAAGLASERYARDKIQQHWGRRCELPAFGVHAHEGTDAFTRAQKKFAQPTSGNALSAAYCICQVAHRQWPCKPGGCGLCAIVATRKYSASSNLLVSSLATLVKKTRVALCRGQPKYRVAQGLLYTRFRPRYLPTMPRKHFPSTRVLFLTHEARTLRHKT